MCFFIETTDFRAIDSVVLCEDLSYEIALFIRDFFIALCKEKLGRLRWVIVLKINFIKYPSIILKLWIIHLIIVFSKLTNRDASSAS